MDSANLNVLGTRQGTRKRYPSALFGLEGNMKTQPNLSGQTVVVVGFGRTGEAVGNFLLNQDCRVVISDSRGPEELGETARLMEDRGARIELGGHSPSTFLKADTIVLSPGVAPTIDPLVAARKKGIHITGEIELASRFVTTPIVGVTGTNGKTTTTSLIADMLKASGKSVFVGGNIGRPFIEFVNRGEKADLVVLELSSFQLETVETFHPVVGALLNVTPDHMDRYADGGDYLAAKTRIFANMGHQDHAVMNADDIVVSHKSVTGSRWNFSRRRKIENGAGIEGHRIVVRREGRQLAELPLSSLALEGAHNQENIMAALLAALAAGANITAACRAAADFKGLPHRLEFIRELGGVRYYNDSKGTNVGAVVKSLEGFDAPVVLIAGGRDKRGDFSALESLVREKVKTLILLGEAGDTLAEALGGLTETVRVGDMAEAVDCARGSARAGDVVLLSPACASFDMFRDYTHRGRVFTELVGKLED